MKRIGKGILIGLALGALFGCEKAPDPAIARAEQEVRCDALEGTVKSYSFLLESDDDQSFHMLWDDRLKGKDPNVSPEMAKLIFELWKRREAWLAVPVKDRFRDRKERADAVWKIARPICLTIPGIKAKQ